MLTKKEPETFTYEEAAAYIEEIPKFTKKHGDRTLTKDTISFTLTSAATCPPATRARASPRKKLPPITFSLSIPPTSARVALFWLYTPPTSFNKVCLPKKLQKSVKNACRAFRQVLFSTDSTISTKAADAAALPCLRRRL